ncbi:uncharacterized [Tachysurus ichikawai]
MSEADEHLSDRSDRVMEKERGRLHDLGMSEGTYGKARVNSLLNGAEWPAGRGTRQIPQCRALLHKTNNGRKSKPPLNHASQGGGGQELDHLPMMCKLLFPPFSPIHPQWSREKRSAAGCKRSVMAQ